jgi:hypothetical protein
MPVSSCVWFNTTKVNNNSELSINTESLIILRLIRERLFKAQLCLDINRILPGVVSDYSSRFHISDLNLVLNIIFSFND